MQDARAFIGQAWVPMVGHMYIDPQTGAPVTLSETQVDVIANRLVDLWFEHGPLPDPVRARADGLIPVRFGDEGGDPSAEGSLRPRTRYADLAPQPEVEISEELASDLELRDDMRLELARARAAGHG